MDPLLLQLQQDFRNFLKRFDELENFFKFHKHQGFDQSPPLPTPRVLLQEAATINSDFKLGSHFYCTMTDNRTLGNPSNARDGQRFIFELIQDSTGSRLLTLDTKFALGTSIAAIVLTTTASKRDFIEGHYSAADDKFYITKFVKGY